MTWHGHKATHLIGVHGWVLLAWLPAVLVSCGQPQHQSGCKGLLRCRGA